MESALYEGWVWHRRLRPVHHEFRYPVFMTYLDLAELPRVFARRWLWSASRPALARFRRDDHFGEPAVPLDESVRALVRERTGLVLTGPIRLLTNLRTFGYCFNPISLYYCFDSAGGQLAALVAEVSNTPWGERHCYVLDARESARGAAPLDARFPKVFHVSPFMGMGMEYRLTVEAPSAALSVAMESRDPEGLLFEASLALTKRPITAGSLARMSLRYPFITGQVIARIYWQALKLWAKGVPYVPHPRAS